MGQRTADRNGGLCDALLKSMCSPNRCFVHGQRQERGTPMHLGIVQSLLGIVSVTPQAVDVEPQLEDMVIRLTALGLDRKDFVEDSVLN